MMTTLRITISRVLLFFQILSGSSAVKLKDLFHDRVTDSMYRKVAPLGFYANLHHYPEIMNGRFQSDSPPPLHDPNVWKLQKRTPLDLVAATPSCPYITEWKLIYNARDINDSDVIVYQPEDRSSGSFQWFYTATCDTETLSLEKPLCNNCCRGVDENRFSSNCIPKKSYVMALVKRRWQDPFEWNWIQINTGCSCAVSERFV